MSQHRLEDDDNPLPEWMRAETYRNPQYKPRPAKTLQEAIEETLRKPPVPIIIKEPNAE
jgi:hypothetical protein